MSDPARDRLREALEAIEPYVEFYMPREISSPSNGEEGVLEAREALTKFRAGIAALAAQPAAPNGPEELIARRFHETYERLAPQFGYSTRKESAVPWEQVPENNRRLMIAVVAELESWWASRASGPAGRPQSEHCPHCGGTKDSPMPLSDSGSRCFDKWHKQLEVRPQNNVRELAEEIQELMGFEINERCTNRLMNLLAVQRGAGEAAGLRALIAKWRRPLEHGDVPSYADANYRRWVEESQSYCADELEAALTEAPAPINNGRHGVVRDKLSECLCGRTFENDDDLADHLAEAPAGSGVTALKAKQQSQNKENDRKTA